jgi:creatinine amidohydrolase
MRLQDLNWMDVERYIQQDSRIILSTGATEQHGYLSLQTPTLIAGRLALAVAQREQVLAAPTLNFGVSEQFADFPGTICISRQTFDALLTEVAESLFHQGFSRFLIINGHPGGQIPVRLRDWSIETGARIVWFDWWRAEAMRLFENEHGLRFDHGNWGENFPFVRVAEVPTGEKPLVNLELIDQANSQRSLLGDGSFGGAYQIDDALIMTLFDALTDEIAGVVRALTEDAV